MATLGLIWSPELDAFKKALHGLPEELAREADHRAEEAAQGAAVAIRQVYAAHMVTGNLARGVSVTQFHRGKLLPGWSVTSRAPHTWLFERGSVPRSYTTKAGTTTKGSGGKPHATGKMWGKTPNPGPNFFPTTNRFRRALEAQLIDMVRRHGLTVTQGA